MRRRPAILGILLNAALIWAGLSGTARAEETEVFEDASIEALFKSYFPKLARHKALTIGPRHWYVSFSARSEKQAIERSLSGCNKRHSADPAAKGAKSSCKLYAVNGRKVWKGPVNTPRMDENLPLPDRPLERGFQSNPVGMETKGVVLHLHGCDGFSVNDWTMTWVSYFNNRGFVFAAPNSFEETRPPAVCGTGPATRERDFVFRLRIAQARRSIRELRKKYPRLPLFIWAHSEGAFIVQAIDVPVNGVIATGNGCGFGTTQADLIPRGVPVLYVFGDRDPYIRFLGDPITPKSAKKHCGPYFDTKKRRIVVVKNANHYTPVWRKEIMDAVSRLIGEKPFDVTPKNAAEILSPDDYRLQSFEISYQARKGKRAMAVGPHASIGMAGEWDFEEDAIQDALHSCGRMAAQNPAERPYTEGGSHICRLYAVNGAIVAGADSSGNSSPPNGGKAGD